MDLFFCHTTFFDAQRNMVILTTSRAVGFKAVRAVMSLGGQNVRKAALNQDKAYAKIDEQVALLLQLAKPVSALIGDQLGRLTKILLKIEDAYTLPNYEPRRSPKRSRYSSDDSDDDQ
uniref:SDR family NAD(P)-dependent oxidoreductase n=1 Tax=Haemonchus contortus TaxID=6289 RepID=A0A7I4Z3L2_HAECO